MFSRRKIALTIASAIVVLAALLAVLLPRLGARPRNVLLITIDTLRPDHLGCYGYGNIRTPNIDRLAEEGVRFEKVVVPVPLTTPSHASILTGVYPTRHKIRDNAGFVLAPGCLTLAEVLQAKGYATGAVVSAAPLAAEFGLNRGFDFYDDRFTSLAIPAKRTGDAHAVPEENEKKGDEATAAALEWLRGTTRSATGRPFFLWVHYYDPHVAYAPPQPFRDQYPQRPYDGEIAYTDACIGKLLDGMKELGVYENTHVILTADHGESLGEHGELTHGIFLYDATVLVPLILHPAGGQKRGVVYPHQVRSVDIMPTILDLAGVSIPDGLHGRDLMPAVAHGSQPPNPVAYLENYANRINFGWCVLRGIRTDTRKYIHSTLPELYELDVDPGETKNRVNDSSEADRMKQKLSDLISRLATDAGPEQTSPGSSAVLAKLRSLGYAAGGYGFSLDADDAQRPDPKQMIGVGNDMLRALAMAREGKIDEAILALEKVCNKDKTNVSAWHWLANLTQQAGYEHAALSAYRKAVALAPDSPGLRCEMGYLLMKMGDLKAAEETYRSVIRERPKFAQAHKGLADVCYYTGRIDDAAKAYARAIELDPADLDAQLERAFALTVMKDQETGLEEYRKIIETHPKDAKVRCGLADALRALGKYKEAVDELHLAIKLAPDRPAAYLELAGLLLDTGHYKEAKVPIARSLQILPDSARAANQLGKYYYLAGDKKKAELAYRKAVYLNPGSSEYHSDLGAALQKQRRFSEAIREYEKAVRLDDRNADALFNLGSALFQAKRDAEGVAAFRRALALRPDFARRVLFLLNQLLRLEPKNKAAASLRNEIKGPPVPAKDK
ncbi:MAG: sulfatase-like hydrolase/transferase [Planctomycetes bacterium]|nr:sulfatase-like hydrolase/transferase [Planctomycetota bacterium]